MPIAGSTGFAWYAIQYPLPRTGDTEIEYVYASSAQQATETQAGAVLLGGPYNSEPAAESAFPQGSSGSVTPPGNEQPSQSDTPTTLTGLDAIGDFFQRLTQAATWVRVAEVTLGTIVVVVALNKLLGDPIGKTTKNAGKIAESASA